MQLQIREWHYNGDQPELIGNTGHVTVTGCGVAAQFDFAGYRGITLTDAKGQAQFFADAVMAGVFAPTMEADLGAVIEADFLKACQQ
jgi:hypothetical protein